ncbi:MAG: hypothetical protein ACXVMS_11480 [Flavisolibacter sp.]
MMKRMLFSVLLVTGMNLVTKAQTAQSQTVRKPSFLKTKNSRKAHLSNRNIYHWSNGQKATPTGTEATSSNGEGYAALKKDTAKLVKKRKQ